MKKVLWLALAVLLFTAPVMASVEKHTLLDGVTTTGASATKTVIDFVDKTFYIVASSVTTGGTVLVQTSYDGSNWATIGTVSVTGNGTTEVAVTGMTHRYIRVNLSARTDGTYTVTAVFKD